jgi:hypothetical protein
MRIVRLGYTILLLSILVVFCSQSIPERLVSGDPVLKILKEYNDEIPSQESFQVLVIPDAICQGCVQVCLEAIDRQACRGNNEFYILTTNRMVKEFEWKQQASVHIFFDEQHRVDFLPIKYSIVTRIAYTGQEIDQMQALNECEFIDYLSVENE